MRKASIIVSLLLIMVMAVSVSAVNAATSDPTCKGSLPNVLKVGMHGQIAERFSTLRTVPGGSTFKVYYAASAGTFTVLEAAKCAATGPLWWVHIRYDNLPGQPTGWAAESQVTSIYGSNRYWLKPVPAT